MPANSVKYPSSCDERYKKILNRIIKEAVEAALPKKLCISCHMYAFSQQALQEWRNTEPPNPECP